MKPQFTNNIMSSFLLWLDNKILTKGEAFYNVGSKFYPTNTIWNGFYAYSAPYKQFIYDSSVPGATVMTGIYLNNNFIGTGISGFKAINYQEGLVLFSNNVNSSTISGNYSAKEINVKLVADSEEKVLFETKYYKNGTITVNTGNYTNYEPFPVIYVSNDRGSNEEFAFGGEDITRNIINCIVFADSSFQLDALKSIFEDSERTCMPILTGWEFPFNVYGHLKTGYFNYTGVYAQKIQNDNSIAYVQDVNNLKLNSELMKDIREINPNIFVKIYQFDIEAIRNPRI
jgi:hypothetical protein